GKVNYFIGTDRSKWRTGLPTYEQIVYRNLWPGVDMVFRGGAGRLKYEFVVRAGARAEASRLAYRGTAGLSLDRAGNLVLRPPLGPLRDERPQSFQEIGGRRVPVETRFALERGTSPAGVFGFAIAGRYDS